jgi:hypothetical protein
MSDGAGPWVVYHLDQTFKFGSRKQAEAKAREISEKQRTIVSVFVAGQPDFKVYTSTMGHGRRDD